MASHRVHVPTPLRSYTGNKGVVEVKGHRLGGLLRALDKAHPGIRFRIVDEQDRIRRHIRIFVNESPVSDPDAPLAGGDEISIICAISGG
jgi:molybdopterin converting factor small subunit